MPWLTIELSDDVASRVADLARERSMSAEAVVRELLDAALSNDAPDFIGIGHSGRGDLSERAKELRQAEGMLADGRVFTLSPEAWERFTSAVDRPARDVPGLGTLMRSPTVLD